jgi:hypothetical protein
MKSRFGIRTALASACFSAYAYAISAQAAAMPERLMCATVEAMDCEPGAACFRGRPAEIGAPPFMRIDLASRTIAGAQRTTPIVSVERNEESLLLQGTETGYAWTLVIDTRQGTMAATLVNGEGAFVLFGSCTPM